MFLTILSWLFSLIGISLIALVFGGLAALCFFKAVSSVRRASVWTAAGVVFTAIAVGHVYAGVVFQAGAAACEARVEREVAVAIQAQKKDDARAIAAANAELDELGVAKATAEQRLAELIEERAAAGDRCKTLTQEEADAINNR